LTTKNAVALTLHARWFSSFQAWKSGLSLLRDVLYELETVFSTWLSRQPADVLVYDVNIGLEVTHQPDIGIGKEMTHPGSKIMMTIGFA
ncbi:MAG: hypothetical protein VB124_04855, partial [Burkholderia sp.]